MIMLDARCTRQMSVGMKRYAREMAARLPRLASDLTFTMITEGENFGFTEQVWFPYQIAKMKPQFVHHLSLYAPLLGKTPTIVTIHDLIHLQFPEYFKAHIGPYYQLVVRRLLGRAVRVITDDERTVDELERRLGVAPDKVRVIPLGVDDGFLHAELNEAYTPIGKDRPFLLYAGNHRPHKNLDTLIVAWASLGDFIPYDLVLTGKDDLEAFLPRRRENGARLIFIGDVDEQKLIKVMHAASALVYPSLCEGFGLPMLEALAVGTQVIASETAVPGILREVCTIVEPRNLEAWRQAMGAVRRPQQADRLARRAYSAGFTWDRCVAATAACYREVLEEQKSRIC